MWVHREGDMGAESHVHSETLRGGGRTCLACFRNCRRPCARSRTRARVGGNEVTVWSVFSRTGFILLIFSLSEMGSPWAGAGGRGRSRGEASLVMFEQDCWLLSTG